MTNRSIIEQTENYVRSCLDGEASGHDWRHVSRVRNNALLIGQGEGADLFVVELAALLHDIGDWKFSDGDDTLGPKMVRAWLEKLNVEEPIIAHVADIVRDISFKGAKVKTPMKTLEGKVVQDADRLDAIGAIGIARTFAYGGFKGQPMYDPDSKPTQHESFDEYKNSRTSTINHFYEKLLLLKDLMNTDSARKIAEQRHQFMENYLKQFYEEWGKGE